MRVTSELWHAVTADVCNVVGSWALPVRARIPVDKMRSPYRSAFSGRDKTQHNSMHSLKVV